MPTQEERLAAVEQSLTQFKAETVKTYQDMAMHLTMIKGLTETIIGRLATMQWQADQRFNTVETRLDRIEETLGSHTDHLTSLETTLGNHTALLTQILERLPEKP